MTPKRVLFIGNSITIHPDAPQIGWHGVWGMAASSKEKDFVHLLLRRFADQAGGVEPEARVESGVAFERGYATLDLASEFRPLAEFRADLVVLAIGENVAALETDEQKAIFRTTVAKLLRVVTRGYEPTLVVRSCFWADPVKDTILREVCEEAGGIFVDNSDLGRNEANYARSEREYEHKGVAAHPGDAGMAAIADSIWKALPG
jgi:hypothetical protein